MNTSLVIAGVREVTKRYGQQDHKIITRLGVVFHANEDCEGLAALKPGMMAIFHLNLNEKFSRKLVPNDWRVSKIEPHPTNKDICSALLSFGKN